MDAERRAVLRGASGAASLGIASMALPAASAAASPVPDGSVQLASTTVTLTPRGYGDTGTTGAIGVSWDAVTDADSYTVWTRSGSDEFAQVGEATAGTSAVLSGLTADTSYDVRVVASADDPAYASSLSTTVSANSSIATGGTLALFEDGATYIVHIFKNTGENRTAATFRLNRDIDVHHLVVAGGGGGGGDVGGGGGAGGLLTSIGGTAVPRTAGDHAIRVGRGGDGGGASANLDGIGGDGFASSAFGVADDDPGVVYAVGGGGGGTWGGGDAETEPGREGGSGGGGAGYSSPSSKSGGSGTPGPPRQGYDGGAGWEGSFAGGGGGGAGGTGTPATGNSGAAGGAGLAVAIVPTATAQGNAFGEVDGGSVHFAGGGGAGADGSSASGGIGGGGDGTDRAAETVGAAGGAATGGGGGAPGGPYGGGAGGSGVVVLRYELPT